MKEILSINKNDLQAVESVNQKKELKFLGSYRKRINGGKLFRYCKIENKIFEAQYEKERVFRIGQLNKAKLVVEKESIYIEALNAKNALKRLKKGKIVFVS